VSQCFLFVNSAKTSSAAAISIFFVSVFTALKLLYGKTAVKRKP